ncbi:MAG: cation:proton antiporter [Saprospiraceae bacterium]
MMEFLEHLMHEFELPLKNPVLVFSLVLLIILLSPLLLKRINIPGIIGLIISGVIIGPHGFNILEKNSAVDLFSTIGLLYIMFIAGLELDMGEFKVNRNKSLVFGFFTFALPIALGFPACYYGLGYDFNASFLTASMFATHTLVAYPIVSKLGVSKNQAVAITVGGTILTDTAVLIILAVIMGANEGSLNQEFWIRLGVSLAIFGAIMFILVPRVAGWFFRKLESEKHSHYIFVLAVVFFAAFLAEVAGVEPIIGAFMAGLALNSLIPHSSALMNRIEFIGNSLFIPFFLISVGMLVDVQVILKGPNALIVAGVLTVVALIGKWVAALATQWIFKYTGEQRQLIFGLSSAHAAATLAVILVGFKAGILDENILNGTIILILITCIVASFATERAAKKIVMKGEPEANALKRPEPGADEHILLPVANPASLEKLLDFAVLIKNGKSANPISLLTVVPNNDDSEANIIQARNAMEGLVQQGSASDTRVNVLATIDHNPASGIVRTSKEIMSDMIVLGWPQRVGMLEKLMGEKLEYILGGTDKMVMICYFERPLPTHKRMLAIVPPLSQLEKGFAFWAAKMSKLAQELSIPVTVCCNAKTEKAIRYYLRATRQSVLVQFSNLEEWDEIDFSPLKVQKEDLLVVISSRKGSISHTGALEKLPSRMERKFEEFSRIVIFPQAHTEDHPFDEYEDFSGDSIQRNIDRVKKIGKGLRNIFRPEPKQDE